MLWTTKKKICWIKLVWRIRTFTISYTKRRNKAASSQSSPTSSKTQFLTPCTLWAVFRDWGPFSQHGGCGRGRRKNLSWCLFLKNKETSLRNTLLEFFLGFICQNYIMHISKPVPGNENKVPVIGVLDKAWSRITSLILYGDKEGTQTNSFFLFRKEKEIKWTKMLGSHLNVYPMLWMLIYFNNFWHLILYLFNVI